MLKRLFRRSRIFRLVCGLGVSTVSVVVLFSLAVLILGNWEVNSGFRSQPDGVEVFVRSNGAHTDILLPREGLERLFESSDFPGPEKGQGYLAFGWGHREVYEQVPEWNDLTLRLTLRAAFGLGETALHVSREFRPQTSEKCKSLRISSAQLRALQQYMRNSLALDSQGRSEIGKTHYHDNDVFYQGQGTYTVFNTCNTWTVRGLKQAGITTCVWTPFPGQVMDSLPQ